jgi:thiamine-phosphate pyrophosphorylase
LLHAVEQALQGGVGAVQLREKDLPVRVLLDLAGDLRNLTRDYGARLFINDRLDVAMAVEADGVHLGQQSLSVEAVRRVAGNSLRIGVSTHCLSEAKEAEKEGADFIVFGPVYETPSKKVYGPPVGMARLEEVVRNVGIPVFAIGGIRSENLLEVLSGGAFGVAVISAILGAESITEAARKIVSELQVVRLSSG